VQVRVESRAPVVGLGGGVEPAAQLGQSRPAATRRTDAAPRARRRARWRVQRGHGLAGAVEDVGHGDRADLAQRRGGRRGVPPWGFAK